MHIDLYATNTGICRQHILQHSDCYSRIMPPRQMPVRISPGLTIPKNTAKYQATQYVLLLGVPWEAQDGFSLGQNRPRWGAWAKQAPAKRVSDQTGHNKHHGAKPAPAPIFGPKRQSWRRVKKSKYPVYIVYGLSLR